jgi:hypothetical protein
VRYAAIVGYFIAMKGVFPVTRALAAWWKARRSAGEIAGVPEEFDTQPRNAFDEHVDDALAVTVERIAAEESPLLREIYAAQALAREGVDVYAKAPKERL